MEDVDQYLEVAATLDYDAWKIFNEDLRGGRKPNASERAEDKALDEIRMAATKGTLMLALAAIANRVKAHFEAEYAPFQAKLTARIASD